MCKSGGNIMSIDKKRPVYVVGHKNPDTDSICSAIAYANLKNIFSLDKLFLPLHCICIATDATAITLQCCLPLGVYGSLSLVLNKSLKVSDMLFVEINKL